MNQPRTFGPYLLLRRLAVGGMAEIYVASTRGLGGFEKLAALKLVHPHLAADPHFVRMLIEEAKISVLLTHANIAQVFDLGCIDDTYYIAMEFVDGMDVHGLQTAAQQLAQPLPIAVCAYTVAEMLNGLDYAHRKRDASGRPLNIVHRDISPQNVVVSQAGEVKLVDFGIAKSSGQSEGTEAGVIKGKYFYMSPEQAWGDPTDRRSDVFSTGILLHEMLTGHMLYTGKSVPELIAKVRRAEIVPPTALRGDVPEELSAIVMRALEREPGARFQSAIDMGEALRDFLYGAYPAFNAGKLGEFVVRMVEAHNKRQASLVEDSVDDTRKLRALTAADFVRNENSVLFNLRDAGVLATRQDAPSKPKRTLPPVPPPTPPKAPARTSLPNAGSLPPLAKPPSLPPLAKPPSLPPLVKPALAPLVPGSIPPPPPRTPSLPPPAPSTASSIITGPHYVAGEKSRGRISTWPLEEVGVDELPTNQWGAPSDFLPPSPTSDDTEPTGRYVPAHALASMRLAMANAPATIPSVIPSLTPPPPVNPFDEPPITGANSPALMPPRGDEEDDSLGPIPPSPAVPDFEANRRKIPWLAIAIGIAAAVLGVVGFQAWPHSAPTPHLEIVSDPSGAEVRVDGRTQPSNTPLRLVGLEKGRRYSLEVVLPGYHTWRSSHLATGTSVQQIAVLRPITRTLQVATSPPGANVYLGDTLAGSTPISLREIAVGQPIKLRIELAGYVTERRQITISVEQTEPVLELRLTPRR